MAPGNLEISQGIEYKLYAIFCTFSIEMYYHIVHNGSIPWVKFLENTFKSYADESLKVLNLSLSNLTDELLT